MASQRSAQPVPSPLSLLGKGLGRPRSVAGEKVRDIIEHEKPVVPTRPKADAGPAPPTVPPAPAVPNAATKSEAAAKEAASVLTEKNRKHLFDGEIHPKRGNATGWHYEPTGNREKGTYVIEGTRSPPDEHGVYEANAMIQGSQKKDRSSFFPKNWTEKQVESAIGEAYKSRHPADKPGLYKGTTSDGIDVLMTVDPKGQIGTAYPDYKGPKYRGSGK